MLPAMKITEPYSPTARAKASAKPVSSAGARPGRMTANMVCKRAWRPAWRRPPRPRASSSCSTGCTVRTTKGRPMKTSATTMPSGGEGDLDAAAASAAQPIQPFGGIERGEGDAGDGGRQREGQVDRGVEQPPAGEVVAHQHPGDDQRRRRR